MNFSAHDLQHADGLQAVALVQPGESSPIEIEAALRRAIATSEAEASGGAYQASDARWHLSAEELSEPPEIGATLADESGAVWTILSVDQIALGAVWRCVGRKLEIAEQLSQLVTIQRAEWRKGTSGASTAEWIDLYVDLPARIQPTETRVEQTHDQRLARTTHQVFLAQPLAIDENHRVVHADQIYHVVGVDSTERIDRLTVLHVEIAPWPLAAREERR